MDSIRDPAMPFHTVEMQHNHEVCWGTIWHSGRLRIHGESYSFHAPGIDGMEVEAVARSLLTTLFLVAPYDKINTSVHGKRLYEIMKLAQHLPVTDPLLEFNSHTAAIVHPLLHLHDAVLACARPVAPIGLRKRLLRLFGVGRNGGIPNWLSVEQEDLLDQPLARIVNELQAQSPYGYIPRHANDVFETERLLTLHLRLPHTVVCDILDYAEYWVRAVGKAGTHNAQHISVPHPDYSPHVVCY
ncbi:uncharacterized protein B0H18DRAFT_646915 [Fomitopsis serialis]|uniref:uncharacterized protein n=1 Tax=Fomitopsis serialis TaxID=139415 RepID=UPI002007FFC5|nr:uncharacterized protein B0H18DRAFT_646915 [Neoantrodia serialis]KAH9933480.1 hypothetical protein B0H18DRAFT_646915 [Neoantrodia serialis]